MKDQPGKKISPTLGEIIAAAGELAFEYSNNDREGYRLARTVLIEILKNGLHPKELAQVVDGSVEHNRYLH
jgi:hypothetical protein